MSRETSLSETIDREGKVVWDGDKEWEISGWEADGCDRSSHVIIRARAAETHVRTTMQLRNAPGRA